VLTSTFIHASGIGAVTERKIWDLGIHTWADFVEQSPLRGLHSRHRATLEPLIGLSVEALADGRVDFFAARLAAREQWRAVTAFPRIAYLDIETDGGQGPNAITLIGVHDGWETRIYTKGIDLAQFAFECQEFDIFVTFFGAGFDLPMLKRRFPVLERVFADRIHVDLCPLLKGLGYRGGLKSIERQIGIHRRPETDGLGGLDAVRLWSAYLRGGPSSDDALRLLRLYNEEDIVNLRLLLEFALPKLHSAAALPCDRPKLVHTPVLAELEPR
jgi:hypothetical protein